jgi:hypothetical protein
MTFVLSVTSRYSMWAVADRRLSYGDGRPPDDNAVKIMVLETTDGRGLLAYAGLGATSIGTQPSEWMSAVLRGRGGMTFEQSLGVLAAAATRELPKHLGGLKSPAHFIIVPAFIRGVGARLYTIDNVIDPKTRQHWARFVSHQRTNLPGSPSSRIGLEGSGGHHFYRKGGAWPRELLSLVKAHDHGRISDYAVADRLAELSYEAHENVPDTVGPRSIVVWRRSPDAPQGVPAAGHQFYTGVDRDRNNLAIPTISTGTDVQALAQILMNQLQRGLAQPGHVPRALEIDKDELNGLLAGIPDQPDEELR